MMRCLLLVLPAILVCSACQKQEPKGTAPNQVAASAAKPGWKEIKSAGFSLSVPPDWQPIDLTSGDLEKLISAAAESNPGVKNSEATIRAAAASGAIKMMAFGELSDGFAENVNVVVLDQPTTLTPEQMREAFEREITPMLVSGSKTTSEKVSLPAGEGYRMHSQLSMGPGKTLSSHAYIFSKDKKSFTITFTTTPAKKDKMTKLSGEIMQTFRIG